MNPVSILAAGTATGTSSTFTVAREDRPVAIRAFGTVTASETIGTIQYQGSDDGWVNYLDLDDSTPAVQLIAPGTYRFDKDATTGSVGIEIVREGTLYAAAS